VVLQPSETDAADDGRAQLEKWVHDTEERFQDVETIPVPDFWGGLYIVPERIDSGRVATADYTTASSMSGRRLATRRQGSLEDG